MSGKGAVEYVSYADAVGYGTAAVGYVRLLVEAGLDVHWMPYPGDAIGSGRVGDGIGDAELSRGRANLIARSIAGADSGLKPLIEATSRPVDARIRIIHLVPGHWLEHLSPMKGVRHIGIGTWETDTIVRRWVPSLARMDHLCVPSAHNEAVLRASPERLPGATVVPHLCRETLRPPPPARLAGLAKYLGIRPDDAVFYTINAWAPRKRLAQLIDGFARSFTQEDRVALVVKTSRNIPYDEPASPVRDRSASRVAAAIIARAAGELGRPPPRIAIIADEDLPDNFIDGLHTLGHCFVSLSRSEGFGLGAFDAATHARPVITVDYGGPIDYLGADWRGRVPYRMAPAENPSGYDWFDEGHSWPEPDDTAAFALMRRFAADPTPFRAEAEAMSIRIRREFGAEAVTRRLMTALDQVA
jgi:glycosyltransferase involved in cell wall biosynthesis